MKKTEALSIGEIINQAISQTGNQEEFDRQQVCFLWPEVVGPTINRYTTRRWVDRDVLHVCITSASLKNELRFNRSQLVDLLNRALGKTFLTDIILH